jgi:hypothetical protein
MRTGSLLAPLFALLVIVGGILARRRVQAGRGRLVLTDRDIRRIEDEGRIATKEGDPLDHDEIQTEEDAFWEQTWDEPEEL